MVDFVKQASALTRVAAAPGVTPSSDSGEKFLRFKLGLEGKALLSLNIIHQVMRVAASEILPVPQMPSCVLGIYNWRGEMLWLVDIGQLMGFPPLYGDPNLSKGGQIGELMAIVVQTNEQYLGLIVPQINDIELHDIQRLNVPSIGLFPPEVLPYLQGYLIGENQEVLMVLNAEAIARTPLWQVHRQ
ncbi:MAG TPA: chemotaxis protein CheW [Leptolyngbyaceae cyanobacterium]